jgi:colanic acid/amylovoran biosynthesis glycosyltransferase
MRFRDTDALAKTLTYLINHPERWAEMGQAGRLRVEEQYDINKLNDRLVTIYQNLLESGTSYQLVLEPEAVISDRPTPANL